MSMLLGIDLGTQSVKAVLADTDGSIIGSEGSEYPVDIPHPGWAVQDPEKWMDALCGTLSRLRSAHPGEYGTVDAVGLSGQMHGLVLLGADGCSVAPAIIWMDSRTRDEVRQIEEALPREELDAHLQNRVATGFALPSLLWTKRNRPVEYGRACHICSPKDYVRLRLTGELGCERTDASATDAYDMPGGDWYWKLLDALGVDASLFPPVSGPCEVAGAISPGAAAETGLKAGIPVAYGCADESALLLGNGLCGPGAVVVNIGTGATVSAWSNEDVHDPLLRTQTFCNAPDGYAVYGAILGGGINMRWLRDSVFRMRSYGQMTEIASQSPAGSRGLVFLPYTGGERTPHMNPEATGAFFGLRVDHTQADMIRSVMEGVCFALKDCLGILEELGLGAQSVIFSGGGARSRVWSQALCDILGIPLRTCEYAEQAALGACIVAGLAIGSFQNAAQASQALVRFGPDRLEPNPATTAIYEDLYGVFGDLYPATKALMDRSRRVARLGE